MRIKCLNCDNMIQPSTAEDTNGFCMPCYRNASGNAFAMRRDAVVEKKKASFSAPTDPIVLLDQYFAEAATSPFGIGVEKMLAGEWILDLDGSKLRCVFLALYGCLDQDASDYYSRWSTGLDHAKEMDALERLHAKLALKKIPLTDADFCSIIESIDGFERWPDQFSYLLHQMQSCLMGEKLSLELSHWLGRMKSATMNVYNAFADDEVEAERHRQQLAKIERLLATPPA